MHVRKTTPSGGPRVSVKQMTYGALVPPKGKRDGHIGGKLGPYVWEFYFNFEEDPFDNEMWLVDSTFVIRFNGQKIYTNTRNMMNIFKSLFGQDYVIQFCETLAQEFIDEGPSA